MQRPVVNGVIIDYSKSEFVRIERKITTEEAIIIWHGKSWMVLGHYLHLLSF